MNQNHVSHATAPSPQLSYATVSPSQSTPSRASRFDFKPGRSFSIYGDENFDYSPTAAAIKYPEITTAEPPAIPAKLPLSSLSSPLNRQPSFAPNHPSSYPLQSGQQANQPQTFTRGPPSTPPKPDYTHVRRSTSPSPMVPTLPPKPKTSPPLPPKPRLSSIGFHPQRSTSPSASPRTSRYYAPADNTPQVPPPLPPKPAGSLGYSEGSSDSLTRRMSTYSELGATTMGNF